jgi:hypothetical protein
MERTRRVIKEEMTGTVKVESVKEIDNWENGQKTYSMEFKHDSNSSFRYNIPDETTYQSMKQYEGKLIDASWNSNGKQSVNNFKVLKVLGDDPQKK